MADAAQIRQVLLNLINNAVDAAAEAVNGIVSLRGSYASAVVEVEVEDNGKGISSEIADHVFEPFQTTKPRGMGLGLPLSRQIVEAHGGHLWWEPVSPHGTRFHLQLPFNGSAGYGS
jgi:two-component system, LuxR family, sensor kinase FixL